MRKVPYPRVSRSFFDLPSVCAYEYWDPSGARRRLPAPLVAVFLFQATPSERAAIIKQIEDGDETFRTLSASGEVRPVVSVPWLRSVEPTWAQMLKIGQHPSARIFIDKRELQDGKVILINWLKKEWPTENAWMFHDTHDCEAARVPIAKARGLVEGTWQDDQSWFPNRLDEDCRLEGASEDGISDDERWEPWKMEREHTWPQHIPIDLKLDITSPTIISLIHLSLDEMEYLLQRIYESQQLLHQSESDPDFSAVQIINWPVDKDPGAELDVWHIFNHITSQATCPDDVPIFFIDSQHMPGRERKLDILMASKNTTSKERNARTTFSEEDWSAENTIFLYELTPGEVLLAWNLAFELDSTKWWWLESYQSGRRDRRYPLLTVTNPDIPVFSNADIPVVILEYMTSLQEHTLRNIFNEGEESTGNWAHLPPGVNTMDSLMEYFESESFLQYHKSPRHCILLVDKATLSDLDQIAEGDERVRPSVLLATPSSITYRDKFENVIAGDEVGYIAGRAVLEDEDTYRDWAGNSFQGMGLGSIIGAEHGKITGDVDIYTWSVFDWKGEVEELTTVQS